MTKTRVRRMVQTGFTLLELLLVLVILATLAGLAMPAYKDSAEKMRNVEALQNLITRPTARSREQPFRFRVAEAWTTTRTRP
jgi:type IV pilus assembly protein PilE